MTHWEKVEFSKEERSHYTRHFSIPEIGIDGQKKLKSAKVLVAGTGGLGAPILQYLAAAGVGTIGIADFDIVESSNLHRQVLFGTSDTGRPKVEVAKERLQQINPYIDITIHETRLTSNNALDILKDYDVIADATDNFPARYLLNDACVILGKPDVYGSIYRFEGQISVFNFTDKNGNRGPNYRDIYAEPPDPGLVPDCAETGVLGVLPGIIGCLQAGEIIKIITGTGKVLSGKLLLLEMLDFCTRTLEVPKNPDNPLTGDNPEITRLIDYEIFCDAGGNDKTEKFGPECEVLEVSVQKYRSWLDRGESVQLIDVREPYEYEIAHIGGELIPLNTITDNTDRLSRDKKIVIHCQSGKRSVQAVRQLQKKCGFENLYSLKDGMLAWPEEIGKNVSKH